MGEPAERDVRHPLELLRAHALFRGLDATARSRARPSTTRRSHRRSRGRRRARACSPVCRRPAAAAGRCCAGSTDAIRRGRRREARIQRSSFSLFSGVPRFRARFARLAAVRLRSRSRRVVASLPCGKGVAPMRALRLAGTELAETRRCRHLAADMTFLVRSRWADRHGHAVVAAMRSTKEWGLMRFLKIGVFACVRLRPPHVRAAATLRRQNPTRESSSKTPARRGPGREHPEDVGVPEAAAPEGRCPRGRCSRRPPSPWSTATSSRRFA